MIKKSNEPLPDHIFTLLSTSQGVFETILYENGILWFWEKHEQRLFKAFEFFNIAVPGFDLKSIIISHIKEFNDLVPYRIKLICLFPFENPPKDLSEENFLLQISIEEGAPNADPPLKLKLTASPFTLAAPLLGYKTLAYNDFYYSRYQGLKAGYDDVLFYNEQNILIETSYSNIFAVKNDEIFTPVLSSGCLPGTVRSILIKALNIQEIEVHRNSILDYDYFFVSSSVKELRAVGKIDEHTFKVGQNSFIEIVNLWKILKNDYFTKSSSLN